MKLVSFGHFVRKHDGSHVKRYRCPICKKTFSESTSKEIFNQKKPYLNTIIYHELVGGFSQRRTAFVFRITRKTVNRKFLLMGKKAVKIIPTLNQFYPNIKEVQFDDLEAFEHTKCKPLSVVMMVEKKSRWIIGFRVASMSAKGLLADKAFKKYGKRKDNRSQKRRELFQEVKGFINEDAFIRSDKNPHYLNDVLKYFPKAQYEHYLSRKAAAIGQGELKKGGFDPLFTINHTFAMLRANINRLFRKTWCTTKKAENLSYHIALYVLYHNMLLINLDKKDAPMTRAKESEIQNESLKEQKAA